MSKPLTPGSKERSEKTMSSRLLTMKFMQRAAASSPSPPALNPSGSTPPSSKHQKTTHFTPSTPATPLSDQAAIQAALHPEEAQREAAIARVAAERGETRWMLSFVDVQKDEGVAKPRGMKVVKAGYGDIDGGDKVGGKNTGNQRHMITGRRSFGNFNRALEKQQDRGSDSSSSSSDEASEVDADEVDYNDYDGNEASELVCQSKRQVLDGTKSQRKVVKKAAKTEAARLAEQRKMKEVKLKNLTSISGTDGGKSRNADANIECHGCGVKGHKKADCPNRGSKRKGDFDGGRPAKKLNRSKPLNH